MRPLPRQIAAPLAALSAGLPGLLPGRVAAPAAAALNPAPVTGALAPPPPARSPRGRPIFPPVALNVFGSTVLLPSFEMPSPSAAAATVLSILAFFVVVTQGNSLASNALVLLGGGGSSLPVTSAPAPAAPAVVSPSAGATAAAPAASSATPASPATSSPSAPAGAGTTQQPAATPTSPTAKPSTLPPIKHVWVITLGDAGYANTFSTVSKNTYLNTTLARTGEVVPAYYAATSSDLGNEDALVSGQGPTPQILNDCPNFDRVDPGLLIGNQASGDGCVFNAHVPTLLGLMTTAKETWKAYVQGLGGTSALRVPARRGHVRTAARATTRSARAHRRGAVRRRDTAHRRDAAHRRGAIRRRGHATTAGATTCRHPALGAADTATATPDDGYVTWRNPVPYFESVTPAECAAQDVGLNALTSDLKSAASVPTLSLIYADPCDDGSDTGPGTACPSVPDAQDPTANANALLSAIVPRIEASPAYANGQGLILIQFAMAAQSGPHVGQFPQAACCNTPQYPNLASSGSSTTTTTSGSAATTTPGTTTTSTGAATVTGTAATNTATVGTATATTTTATTVAASCPTPGTTTTGTGTGTQPAATATTGTGTVAATATVPTDTGTTGTTPATTTTGTATNCSSTSTTPAPSTDPLGNAATGGGGQIGLLAISKWVTKGSQDVFDTFNTFSLVASLEKLFGLAPAVGYANTAGTTGVWGHGFFSAFTPGAH